MAAVYFVLKAFLIFQLFRFADKQRLNQAISNFRDRKYFPDILLIMNKDFYLSIKACVKKILIFNIQMLTFMGMNRSYQTMRYNLRVIRLISSTELFFLLRIYLIVFVCNRIKQNDCIWFVKVNFITEIMSWRAFE